MEYSGNISLIKTGHETFRSGTMTKSFRLILLIIFQFILFSQNLSAQNQNWTPLKDPIDPVIFSVSAAPNGDLWALGGKIGTRVYVSSDKGNTWKQAAYLSQTFPNVIRVSPQGHIFIGLDGAVLKSTDNGKTWNKRFPGGIGPVRVIKFAGNGRVIVSCGYTSNASTVCASSDYGETWTLMGTLQNNAEILDLSVTGSGKMIASTIKGLYRSTDNGANWVFAGQGLIQEYYHSTTVGKDGTVYAGSQGRIYSSSDEGQSWKISYLTGNNRRVTYLFADSSGSLWGFDDGNVYMSTDNGSNWYNTNSWLIKQVNDMTISPSDGLYAAIYGGVAQLFNGTEWVVKKKDLHSTDLCGVKTAPNGNLYTFYERSIYKSTDKGDSWTEEKINFGSYSYIGLLFIDEKNTLYAAVNNKIAISAGDGNLWDIKTVDDASVTVRSIVTDKKGNLYAGTTKGLYRSTDKGNIWQNIKNVASSYLSIAAFNRSGHIFYAADDGVYKSMDNGVTWNKTSCSYSGGVKALLINRKGHIYLGTGADGLLCSTNTGLSWTQIGIPRESGSASVYNLLESPEGHIYCNIYNANYYSEDYGVGFYVSKDNAQSWKLIDKDTDRLGNLEFLEMAKDGFLYGGEQGNGLLKSTFSVLKILPPENITVKPGDQKVYLSWNKNTSADFLKYRIYWSLVHYPTLQTDSTSGGAEDTSIVIKGLINLNDSYVVISAVDKNGNESFSDEIIIRSIPVPAAPELFEPAKGMPKVKTTSLFKWSCPMFAQSYHLQVSTDSTFNTKFFNDSTLTDTSKLVGNMANSSKYYWRVRAQGVSGVGAWSDAGSFTTVISPPNSPEALSPLNNAVNEPIIQQFKWKAVPEAETYCFQLSEAADFSKLIFEDSTLSGTAVSVSGLRNLTQYYWRVRGKNEGGTGNWMGQWKFTTIIAPPGAPQPIWPEGNQLVQVSTIFKWQKSQRAERYHLQIAGDSLFTGMFMEDSTLTDTLKSISMMSYESRYFWRVKAINTGGISLWSEVSAFRVVKRKPEAVVLSGPANNSINQPVEISLSWQRVAIAETYQMQLSAAQDFNSLVVNDSTIADTLKAVVGLKNNVKYYWRLRGVNNGGSGQWSETWTFTTIVANPGVPQLISPVNAVTKAAVNLRLRWTQASDAASYRLQLGEDSAFTKLIINDSSLTSDSRDITGLKTGMKYYWRVSAKNLAGNSAYSQVWTFITLLPACDSLIAVNQAVVKVKLSWSDRSDNELGFIIERKSEKETDYKVIDSVKANQTSFIDSTVTVTTQYKYRIKAYSEFAQSEYSNEALIKTLVSVKDNPVLVREYSLKQNYPNPFNPSTVIRYSLISESKVTLKVYSAIGEMIRILVDKEQAGGNYEARFNAGDLSSGIYYYEITIRSLVGNDNYRWVKKMMLVK